MRSAKAVLILAILALLASGARLHAQTSTGEVNGTVSDSSGSVIPGATVTLTNQGTGITRADPVRFNLPVASLFDAWQFNFTITITVKRRSECP